MKKFIVLLILSSIIIFYNSCKEDVNINASWKDITIVYGLLNQNDTTHYIKINKAFLGDGDALIMAQEPDSSTYGDALDVKVEEWENNKRLNSFVFDTTSIYNKDSGLFYYPGQIVYKCCASLNQNYKYKLIIKNKDKIVSSETNLVHDFDIEKPRQGQKINFKANTPLNVKWVSAKNGKRYELMIRFHYKEINKHTLDTLNKYIDWSFGDKKSMTLYGGEEMEIQYHGNQFFSLLENQLSYNPDIERIAGKVDYIFTVVGDELNTYLEVNEPSSSIVQERPEYSNINNGIGIFSCRYQKIRSNELSPLTKTELEKMNLNFIHISE